MLQDQPPAEDLPEEPRLWVRGSRTGPACCCMPSGEMWGAHTTYFSTGPTSIASPFYMNAVSTVEL